MRTALFAISITASTVLAGTALAGGSLKDAPPGVVYDWSGIYIGGHIGRGWSGADTELTGPNHLLGAYNLLDAPSASTQDLDGWLAGGHVGIQGQFGRWVLGVEASLTGAPDGFDGSSSEAFGGDFNIIIASGEWDGNVETRVRTKHLLGATGRIGYAWDRWLGYVKGGFVTAKIDADHSMAGAGEACVIFGGCADIAFGASSSSTERHNGWTIGAGLEYMVRPDVIFGIEYNYFDLQAKTHKGLGGAGIDIANLVEIDGQFDTRMRVDPDAVHAVYARLSFKLGPQHEHIAPLK